MKLKDCLAFIRTPTTYCSKPELLPIWPTKPLGLNTDSMVENNHLIPVREGTSFSSNRTSESQEH